MILPTRATLNALCAFSLLTASVVANAGSIKVTSNIFRTPVVELYTSEGCSSCPPADEWITQLGEATGEKFDAVPLAFHVDYWNYLGWEDPFSDARFTERQRELAAINRQSTIYTPEFMVSGKEARGTNAVVRAIQSANAELAEVMITLGLKPNGSDLEAELVITTPASEADLYIAVYENAIVRDIKAGENTGRKLHHDFVVRHWSKPSQLAAGEYQGKHRIELGEDWQTANLGLAAIVVDRNTGETLQAVRTGLKGLFDNDA